VEIRGRSFIVTGAGSGLGRAAATELAREGGRVVCVDLDEAGGRRTADATGGVFVRADVTSEQDVAEAVEEAGPTLAGAVSCAGIAHARRTIGREGPHPLHEFDRVVKVNLVGTFNVARLAASAMARLEPDAEGERGVIVNTSSGAAFEGQTGQAAYAASKGGVVAMTLPVARDLGSVGIRCVAIAPGTFETPMMAEVPEAVTAAIVDQSIFPRRLGRPEEFGALVAHIVRNRMLNAEVIRLDGACACRTAEP
jgi:NAD(P)-dependent dehydrogenase (short-subunit alcohol dehydrogenase family)